MRSFYLNGGPVDPSPLSHEARLPCLPGAIVDAAAIWSPAYMYWGGADTTVPVSVLGHWQAALPNIVKTKVYPGEGHTVQYRHWDQVLVDMAGHVTTRWSAATARPSSWPTTTPDQIVAGGATLGLCAWAPAP